MVCGCGSTDDVAEGFCPSTSSDAEGQLRRLMNRAGGTGSKGGSGSGNGSTATKIAEKAVTIAAKKGLDAVMM